MLRVAPMDRNVNYLAVKKFNELVVGKIIRLDDSDLVSAAYQGAHRQEQRTLRSWRQDDLRIWVYRSSAELSQLRRKVFADIRFPSVFRVCLMAAAVCVAKYETLEAARYRLMRVNVAM